MTRRLPSAVASLRIFSSLLFNSLTMVTYEITITMSDVRTVSTINANEKAGEIRMGTNSVNADTINVALMKLLILVSVTKLSYVENLVILMQLLIAIIVIIEVDEN